MKVNFIYDPTKEIIPLKFGFRSPNSDSVTDFSKELQDSGTNLTNGVDIASYCERKIEREKIDIDFHTERVAKLWGDVEKEAEKRLGKLFNTSWDPGQVTGYLTLNTRCPYNLAKRYFFINFSNEHPVQVCLHELLHFYTHQLLEESFIPSQTFQSFNNFKESLTALLNIEFSDILDRNDQGYPQHQELREHVVEFWQKSKDLRSLSRGELGKL